MKQLDLNQHQSKIKIRKIKTLTLLETKNNNHLKSLRNSNENDSLATPLIQTIQTTIARTKNKKSHQKQHNILNQLCLH